MIHLKLDIGQSQSIRDFLKYLGLSGSGCKSSCETPPMTVDSFNRVRVFEENELRFEANKEFDA